MHAMWDLCVVMGYCRRSILCKLPWMSGCGVLAVGCCELWQCCKDCFFSHWKFHEFWKLALLLDFTMSTDTKKASEPPIRPSTLLAAAGSAFVVGLAGSIWQANRKHAREMKAEAAAATNLATESSATTVAQVSTTAKPTSGRSAMPPPPPPPHPQPVMTAAEYAKSRADARHFALRSFGYGTLAAFGGVGVLSLLTAWWFEVSSVR